MTVNVNKIYNQFFSDKPSKDWDAFRSKPAEIRCPKEVDFSVSGPMESTARKIALIALKLILFPWALYCGTKWLLQRFIMLKVYPVQNSIVKLFVPQLRTNTLDEQRSKMTEALSKKGFIVRHVALEKNGNKMSGMLVTHPKHSQNGKWVLQACGNFQPYEYGMDLISEYYHRKNFNVLLINNPGVGKSEGTATPDSIGDAQEMGISFLETALKAKKIVLAGFSLGGAAIGQAILKHDFKKPNEIKYLAIRQMSFDRVSNICKHKYKEVLNINCFKSIVSPLVKWAGCEMDSVEASKKLQRLQIPEIIIQRVDDDSEFACDGSIPKEASLGYCLHKEGIVDKTKTFVRLQNIRHLDADFVSLATVTALHEWEIQHQPSFRSKIASFFRSIF